MLQIDPAIFPEGLRAPLERNLERISSSLENLQCPPADLSAQLATVLIGSDFVSEQLSRFPNLLADLVDSGDLWRFYQEQDYRDHLSELLNNTSDEASLHRVLRQFRRREQIRIIFRDLNRLSDVIETTRELSWMADTAIDLALEWLYQEHCQRLGTPMGRESEHSESVPQKMVVLGMGKLGANELNLSSDIDLIFCFPRNGETVGKRDLSNQEFFIRLGKKLIQALDAQTMDGFVFRVDMRLRPFGGSGPLSASFDAMEIYYQEQGREWERYAMIKARVVAGDKVAGQELMGLLRPFVYRKYIDFSVFESLRDMKEMINREVRRKGLQDNVKLGAGGIREVEFIAQVFQLIRGGRDNRLQQRELRHILPLLPETVGMPQPVVEELWDAYQFLRNSEHGIQALDDRQTQELPSDPQNRLRLAWVMGFEDYETFHQQLMLHRSHVSQHFAEVMAPPENQANETDNNHDDWISLWDGATEESDALLFLQQQGFDQAERSLQLLNQLSHSRTVTSLQQIAMARLKQVLPSLLSAAGKTNNSQETLERVLQLIQAILRRSAYLALLSENKGALEQLVKLCSASPWFSQQLAKKPLLLDELIDLRTLYKTPEKAEIEAELQQLLLRVPEDDVEQLMEVLRYFKSAMVLRVAASDITGALPLMKVSDCLTWTAEAILKAVLEIAWKGLTEKHGAPQKAPGVPSEQDFIVIGYGKLGGIELSYGSDLDLVFIHDAHGSLETDGAKPIGNNVFFTRLGQRIIHILNTFTPSGLLYEVDMRLRPSGNSGMLVTSLEAFQTYQLEQAWTWEHQALVRARVVAGQTALQQRFEEVRSKILAQTRDQTTLRQEVSEMRQKMRTHLGTQPSAGESSQLFNLKQDAGGIVDIEFLVQYFVLANSQQYPELLSYTDNIRILDRVEKLSLLTNEEAELLRQAYTTYRALGHRLTLQEQGNNISDGELQELRSGVEKIWNRVMKG